jgi:hypothetical protein
MKRPIAVTVLGCLFILVGCTGLVYHLSRRPLEPHIVLVSLVRAAAVVGGVALLYGKNWARWLLIAWMGFHVGISALHSWGEVLFHLAVFGVIGLALQMRPVSKFLDRETAR